MYSPLTTVDSIPASAGSIRCTVPKSDLYDRLNEATTRGAGTYALPRYFSYHKVATYP